ncbi:unnamed protein product, partial [Scytosiphon promiscuus]
LVLQVVEPRTEMDPWVAARMVEIPFTITGSALEQPVRTESTIRFDGFLVDTAGVASRILNAATTSTPSSSLAGNASPDKGWGDWGEEGDRAIAVAVQEALIGTATSVYDQMAEEIKNATTREASGDWLEAADATCASLVPRRRQEILDLYHDGRAVGQDAVVCSEASDVFGSGAKSCNSSAEEVWLANSTASLTACRGFFDTWEMEYAKAACLRAARLGGLSASEAAEIDMRLAATAERFGQPSAAVQLYLRMMGNPATNENGRLVMSILGLTMVPPTLIGSLKTVREFRAGWVRDLRTLRRNILTGITPGKLWDPASEVGRTPFNLAHQGGPELQLMTSLAGVYDASAPSLRFSAPHCDREGAKGGSDLEARTQGSAERSIRIGFFSSHLRDHSIGRMMSFLIVLLAENPNLEVHVFGPAGGTGDGADGPSAKEPAGQAGTDSIVAAMQSAVHQWHQAPQDLHLARMAVVREELDVLVYPDLGMEALTYFMAFARLAPVQCVWWGHPVTPSTGAIDYFLSLDVELKGGQDDYLEQMVRMDVVNTARFTQVEAWVDIPGEPNEQPLDTGRNNNDHRNNPRRPVTTGYVKNLNPPDSAVMEQPPPDNPEDALKRTPKNVGAAEAVIAGPGQTSTTAAATTAAVPSTTTAHGGPILVNDEPGVRRPCSRNYLVMGRLFKLHPGFDGAVEGILAGDPAGCVVLIHETKDEQLTRAVWSRLKDVLVPGGLFGRLRIMHHWLYPQALRRATAVLDTFPYGGCLTVLESLSKGVPVVTLPAEFVRGRFALAIYLQMGYTDLVADDLQEYVSLAVRLGTDRGFRKAAVANIEGAYRESLHRNDLSAHEWAAFFVRAHRGAALNEGRRASR